MKELYGGTLWGNFMGELYGIFIQKMLLNMTQLELYCAYHILTSRV